MEENDEESILDKGLNAIRDYGAMLKRDLSKPSQTRIYDQGIEAGIPWFVIQGPFSINGYVVILPDHRRYGECYEDIPVKVHGGLTFGKPAKDWIITKIKESYPTGFVYGFDTAHYMDEYEDWGVENVTKEVKNLAVQFSELST
mgnify:CR=1 FL=1